MTEKRMDKATRLIGIVVVICAMALPVHFASAEGGRDPKPSTPSQSSTSDVKPEQPARTTRQEERATTQNRAATSSGSARQTRRTPAQIVETAPSGQPPVGETRFVTDEVIVRFRLSSTAGGRNQAIAGLGLTHLQARTFFLSGVTVHRYQLPAGLGVRDAISQLEARAAIVNAQPNYLYLLQQTENTTKLPQFGNDIVGLNDAHARTKGGKIRIAIIDTAVDAAHPELQTARISAFDVTDAGTNTDPHGTSIAGILAANAKLTGVAPEAEIVSIAAFAKDASGNAVGNTWTILEALNVAHDQKADILNLSFAGPADPLLERAMKGAKKRNILPVAAAGNDGPAAATLFPAGYDAVIAVTATDPDNKVYSRANTGDHVDLAAPGVDLLVLGNTAGFRTSSGTSMATAYVSGIAALALSANPGADYTTLRAMLENSTIDLGQPGKDSVFGAGIPSAAAAIGGLLN